MNIKLQRVVRTAASEEIVIRDLDLADREGAPRTIGKVDVHYTEEGVYGTLLLWPEVVDGMTKPALDEFVQDAIIDELTGLIGVPETYNIEFYCPDMKRYKLYSNLPEEE
jgi:hypothetical protein